MNDIVVEFTAEEGVPDWHGYSTPGSAGVDLQASEDIKIERKSTVLVSTGLRMSMPEGYVGVLASRSSVGIKGLPVAQGIGVIDSDYRGELKVPLYNRTNGTMSIKKGDRIAQLLFMPVVQPMCVFVEELDDTHRGEGGFGSTG